MGHLSASMKWVTCLPPPPYPLREALALLWGALASLWVALVKKHNCKIRQHHPNGRRASSSGNHFHVKWEPMACQVGPTVMISSFDFRLAAQKANSKLVTSRPESDSEVTQLGIGVGGPSSPWGLPGSNESWISLQSDSDWIEISFHLKFVLACTWRSTSQNTCWASTLHNSMHLQTQANVKQQPDSV